MLPGSCGGESGKPPCWAGAGGALSLGGCASSVIGQVLEYRLVEVARRIDVGEPKKLFPRDVGAEPSNRFCSRRYVEGNDFCRRHQDIQSSSLSQSLLDTVVVVVITVMCFGHLSKRDRGAANKGSVTSNSKLLFRNLNMKRVSA